MSSEVSPQIRSATRNPATSTGVHDPARIASKALRIVAADVPSADVIASKACTKRTVLFIGTPIPAGVRQRCQPVLEQGHACGGQNRFGMELYAFDRMCLVAQAHDFPFGCPRG